MNKTPTTLIIMDGFGLSDHVGGNAVKAAKTPRLDQFLSLIHIPEPTRH